MKAIIFDVDGTIIDTEYVVLKSLQETLSKEEGIEKDWNELHAIFGVPGRRALERLGANNIENIMKIWTEKQKEHYDEVTIFDGMEETLEKIYNSGIPMGVVTSKTNETVEAGFTPFGLNSYFKDITTASDTKKHKPEADPLLHCLENMNETSIKETLYIGDSIFDYKSAKAAGMKFGLALWGAKTKEGFEEADYFFDKPQDILQVIKR